MGSEIIWVIWLLGNGINKVIFRKKNSTVKWSLLYLLFFSCESVQ
jgi:hypothetical protein